MKAAAARSAARLWIAASCIACGCSREPAPFDPDTIPEAYRRPTGALMWPGATRSYLVTPAGDLYNGAWQVWFEAVAGGEPAGAPRVIAAEERWLPVLRWTRRAGDVRFAFEAVTLGSPRDSNLVASLALEIANEGAAPREIRFAARLAYPDSTPVFVAFDAPAERTPLRWAATDRAALAHAWAEDGASGAGGSDLRATLPPGGRRRLRFAFPAYPMPDGALRSWARTAHRERVAEARRYWNDRLSEGIRLELGDLEVERAVAAARVVLLACRERRGDRWVPIGGPFHYRDTWIRDGARAIQALALSGHTQLARDMAHGMLAFQWPQGAFLSQRGQLDGTGQALWMMDQALMRPSPEGSLEPFADAALAAWRWLESGQEMGRGLAAPFGLMMPFGDPKDNELVRAQLVGNDAWAIAGCRSAATLLRASGRVAAAAEVEDSLLVYRAEFDRALARTTHPDLPPSWQEVGRDWGNLTAGYPCRIYPPRHPRLVALADRVWAAAGGAGLAWYGTRDSLHYYLGADLGTWALLAGRPAQADSVLEALLRWRTAGGGAGELFTRAGEFGVNLPPHATSAAALITLVRNSLVFDEGDTLRLTLGARAPWWRGARVRRAPTRWGIVDLEFHGDQGSAEWRWTPVPVPVVLTLPPGTRLPAPPAPPLLAGATDRELIAPPGARAARVALAPAAR